MASILGHLDRLADEHPHKLLYSYLDVNGDPIESYTYASFLQRTKAIAGHLRKETVVSRRATGFCWPIRRGSK
jgi:acyl-CoA synthetase (AMP-forming)/AMP-acid ligase II